MVVQVSLYVSEETAVERMAHTRNGVKGAFFGFLFLVPPVASLDTKQTRYKK